MGHFFASSSDEDKAKVIDILSSRYRVNEPISRCDELQPGPSKVPSTSMKAEKNLFLVSDDEVEDQDNMQIDENPRQSSESIASMPSPGPLPTKKRRFEESEILPVTTNPKESTHRPKQTSPKPQKSIQQSAKSELSSNSRRPPAPPGPSWLNSSGFLGEFIVEGWATTSDTKATTYLRSGDSILVQRDVTDDRLPSKSGSTSNQRKGNQTTLSFASKSKPAPKAKKILKENNIVRFLNANGSGM